MREPLSPLTVVLVWGVYSLQFVLVMIPALGSWVPFSAPAAMSALGGLLVIAGLSLCTWGIASFHSFRRMNGMDTSKLITTGAYRYSRNPQNVGPGLLFLGIAVMGKSLIALLAAMLFWAIFRRYVPAEERFLESIYGDSYRTYRAHSHRYFGPAGGLAAR